MLDNTIRALIGFLGYLYNIQISKACLNNTRYQNILRDLDTKLLSMPVSQWTDPAFIHQYIRETAEKLELDMDQLNKHLMKMGVAYDPARNAVK